MPVQAPAPAPAPAVPSNMQNFARGAGMGAGIGGLLGNMFMKNPASGAMNYLNQIPGAISPYYQPYINAGQGALGTLTDQYGQLISNPGQMMNQMGAGFQQSPGYQYNVQQSTNAANQAAAAGGMLGSPQEQQQLAQTTSGLADQDYYNYLDHVTGLYGQGLSGMSGINQMGYNASDQMAQTLASVLADQAGLSYSGQSDRNQQIGGSSAGIGALLGGLLLSPKMLALL